MRAQWNPLLQTGAASRQTTPIDFGTAQWRAQWIHPANVDPQGYGVYLFRRSFELAAKPASFKVHVSADSRYQLYVNGAQVSWGPARGDLFHWRYETVDLAPHLNAGRNTLAAIVWNDGAHAAVSQWSYRTAFLMQAVEPAHEALVNTGPEWRWMQARAYEPIPVPTYQLTGYYAIGPMERFDAARHPWGWEQSDFDDSLWLPVEVGRNASPRNQVDAPSRWMLVPRPIPPMEEKPQPISDVRFAEGSIQTSIDRSGGVERRIFTVPVNSRGVALLDQGFLTTAFPVLEFSGGKGARITLDYTEALFEEMRPRRRKGNRNEVKGKTFIGYGDVIHCDGGRRTWRALFWRTYRYLRATIHTADEPVTIDSIYGIYTGYPFNAIAQFESGVAEHKQIFDVGWRTARLCAHETYMDCPYYEQLQYAGDTRIQALVSLFMTGDPRLARNAIEQLDSSRTSEGATYSRAPSVLQQYIPPFSLWWIGMVHDYMRYVDDPQFVRQMLPGVRAVLNFFERQGRPDGILSSMPWWNYVDWVQRWPRGTPPCEPGMMPATIHLQLVLGLQYARDIENAVGDPTLGTRYDQMAARLNKLIAERFWDSSRRMFSEDLAHKQFSQHANVLAVLAGTPLPDGDTAQRLMETVEADKSIDPCSVYFRYYLDRAMVKAGLGDRYLDRLHTWQFMLKEGLTTWAEQDNPYSRSDCHAWGASPNIEFFRTVLGVDSAAPGFSKVIVKPHLGKLEQVSGKVPHPKGVIDITVKRTPAGYDITVAAPRGVEVERIAK